LHLLSSMQITQYTLPLRLNSYLGVFSLLHRVTGHFSFRRESEAVSHCPKAFASMMAPKHLIPYFWAGLE
jgi:hypothetical protein